MAGRLLACRPLVAIGLVSYSLYLWHQPLLAFARIRFPDGLSDGAMLFILLLCFPLAWLTWRFVEQPVRRRGAFAVRPLVISGAAVAALIVAIGVAGVATGGMPWRLDAGAREIAGFAKKRNALDRNCQAYDGRAIAPADACVFNEGAPRRAALIGDSHADALADAVAEGLRAHGFSLRQMTHAGCLPVPGYRRSDGADHCTPYNRAVGDFLQSRPDVEWVVVAARWTLGLEGERFDNGEGGREAGRPVAGIPADGEALGALYRDAVRFHLAHGRKVVLVYPIPEVGWDVPTLLARKAQLGRPQPQLSTSPALFQSRNRRAIEALDGLPDHPDLIRIRPDAILCDTLIPDRCAAAVDGTPLYRDDDHLSSPGARLLTQAIVAAMGERGWLRDSVATKGGRNSEEARWGGE